jgi:hypothetical protein
MARRPFDAGWLAQELVSQIGAAAGPSDACILIWLITVACEKISLFLPREDTALRLLIRRRTELSERLAGEIDERTFYESETAILDEDDLEIAAPIPTYLSSFEAALLDFSLASKEAGQPWLTYEEAAKLFDERAAEARTELSITRRHLMQVVATLTCSLGMVASIALWLALRSAAIDRTIANPAAVALASFFLAVATRVASRAITPLTEPLGIFFATLTLLASAVAIDEASRRPFISDIGGLVTGTLIAGGAAVLWGLLRRLSESKHR